MPRIGGREQIDVRMKILVTGAGGFVGNAIAREFAVRGHEVFALARRPIEGLNAIHVLVQDLRDASATRHLVGKLDFEIVVHAAANMAGVSPSLGEARFNENATMTLNLLGAFSRKPPRFLMCISSIDVYSQTPGAINEETPLEPKGGYAISKHQTEQLCAGWANERGIMTGVARLTQIFGPGDRTAKMIPASIAAVRKGDPILLYGDGEDRRDFLFVQDAARMVADWCVLASGDTINLATGVSLSMNAILLRLAEVSGADVKVEKHPRRKERRDLEFNIGRLIHALGPQVFTQFQEALKITYFSKI
jgi:UDP-glucose 4-epimerase